MRTMALLLSIAGAAASCTEACGAVACGDGSCTATAFGHRMCADGGSCASTEDLFVEVYPSTSMCASDHVTMNFGVDYVTKNNLGGEGPDTEDEEMLRIDMIGTTSTGSYIALEIRALSAYTPNKAENNGRGNGFTQINLMTGTCTLFEFAFSTAEGPATLGEFYFSLFDLDSSPNGGGTESILIDPGRRPSART